MKKYFLLSIVLFGLHNSYSQTKLINKAEKEYDQLAYASVDAKDLQDKLIEKEYNSPAIYSKLGDSYYFNGNYKKALVAYNQMYKLKGEDEVIPNEQLLRYAQSLKSNGQYSEASKIIKLLNEKSDKKPLYANTDYLNDIKKQSNRYTIKPVSINSRISDYGTAYYGTDKVIFTSARDTNVVKKYIDAWTGKPYFKLYEATVTSEGDLINAKKLNGKVNSVFHQSTPVVTNDGNQMYFTRSNFLGGKLGSDNAKTNHLKIYRATLVNGVWDKIEDLSINNDAYSNAHPALSPDGKSLIFASDRPGSYGQTDLFEVEIKADGTFGEVKNMGPSINTIGRETFPFVTKTGQLYFSSDGQPGLGGLDVFAGIKNKDNSYNVVNVGEPINSTSDDFAFVMDQDSHKGFFTSKRSDKDKIYGFKELEPLDIIARNLTVAGKVFDDTTGELLPKVKISLFDANNKKIDEFYTDNNGEYLLKTKVLPGDYTLVYEKTGYTLSSDPIKAKAGEDTTIILDDKRLKVDPDASQLIGEGGKVITDGDDLARSLGLKSIYFDLDGSRIKKASVVELNKVVQLLKDYPTTTVDVRSHTDSRGNDAYNMKLSERRAKATVDYLLSKGVKPNRVTGKGFGETELLNKCGIEIKCTVKQDEINRRSEFIIHLKK